MLSTGSGHKVKGCLLSCAGLQMEIVTECLPMPVFTTVC